MTEEIIRDMLCENTGSHYLDSGGSPQYDNCGNYLGSSCGYGRNFERNSHRDFENENPVSLKFSIWKGSSLEISFSYNLYHWLNERCELATELDQLFHGKFLKERDADDSKYWLELMEEFPEWLAEQTDADGNPIYGDPSGIYGEGNPITVNTYNEESLLSQVIQYTYFENEAGEFIALQIHGGADVRGGYTTPHIFSVGNLCELDIFDGCRGTIYCTREDHHPTALGLKEKQEKQEKQTSFNGIEPSTIDFDGEHYWYTDDGYTDDGYHWYFEGSCGYGAGTQLEKYEARDLSESDVWEEGFLCVKDGIGYCPRCGARLAGR